MKRLMTAAAITLMAAPAFAQLPECDKDAAQTKVGIRRAVGIITDMGFRADSLVVQIPADAWAAIPLDERPQLAQTISCAVAGPGKALAGILFETPIGSELATWDGSIQEFEE